MEQQILRVRARLAVARRRSVGRPQYPETLKLEAVQAAAALYGAGFSHLAAARELDLNPVTLTNWERAAASGGEPGTAAMLPVNVVPAVDAVEPPRAEPVVHGPLGVRVEGLDVEGIAELLRRLV